MAEEFAFLREMAKAKRDKNEPQRVQYAITQLQRLGYKPVWCPAVKAIKFTHNGNEITFFPYKGWFSGKGIQCGRGIENLIRQLKKSTDNGK